MILPLAALREGYSKYGEGKIRMVMSDRWRMSLGLRRASTVVAVVALAIGGAKVTSDYTTPGSGFSTMHTAAADPTGPTGGPGGGPGGMNGSQFQPPGLPPQMPDYQAGINQPPLDQNSGISIYNSGSPQAPQQVPGQQAGQQPEQAQQPAHGTQIPDYQSNPGYTQGPGQPNPNYQAPQQQSPQQGQQPRQPQQQQPSQAPTQTQQPEQPQNKQDDTTQQLKERQLRCDIATSSMDAPRQVLSIPGGSGSLGQPARFEPGGGGTCMSCDTQGIKSAPSEYLDYFVYQRADIRNMADMKTQLELQKAMKKMDENCGMAAAAATKVLKSPGKWVTKSVALACSLSSSNFDGPMLENLQSAIDQSKCLRIDSYGGFRVTYLIKECG